MILKPGRAFAVLELLVCACSSSNPVQKPTISLRPCALPNLETPAQCGELEVFENRAAATGRTIRLRVAVIPAGGPDTLPDPVFVLVSERSELVGRTTP